MSGAGRFMVGLMAAVMCCAATLTLRYPEEPPLAHTGGFGEPTCQRCHFDQPLNALGGTLALEGIPVEYEPGERYLITVHLIKPSMQRAGFQLSARFDDGVQGGRQAGILEAVNDKVDVVAGDSTAVLYAQHTKAGTTLTMPDTAQWLITWIAPDRVVEPVIFHIVANAANGDVSEFGDFIYTQAQRAQTSQAPDE